MKQLLIQTLETICPNKVFLQGTLNSDEVYPDNFITFFVDATSDISHYNNDVNAIEWAVSVMYYSNDPDKVATVPNTIRTALKQVGFIPQGKGYDLPSDVQTHTGWAMDFLYREKQ